MTLMKLATGEVRRALNRPRGLVSSPGALRLGRATRLDILPVRQVMADSATGDGAQHGVVVGEVTGDAANHGALETPLRVACAGGSDKVCLSQSKPRLFGSMCKVFRLISRRVSKPKTQRGRRFN